MALPVSSLPLPHSLIKHLISNKLHCLSDIVELLPWQQDTRLRHADTHTDTPTRVQYEKQLDKIQLSAQQRDLLLDYLTEFKVPALRRGRNLPTRPDTAVVTFSAQLDELLNGGVHPGEVLELVGEPCSGCTQLCLQVAVDSTMPAVFGGLESTVLYVDCDGDCSVARLRELAHAALAHLTSIASTKTEVECVSSLSADTMLSNISVVHCTDYAQLLAVLRHIKLNPGQYGVVIVDSLATHFRHEFQDMRHRTNVLASVTNQLHALCITQNTAVVTVNQVMHMPGEQPGESSLQPCLGETWSHTAHTKLLLQQLHPDAYSATILKAPDSKRRSVKFRISTRGIRDVPRDVL